MELLYKGVPIYFTDSGKGRALIFIHGFPMSGEVWSDFIAGAGDTYRKIVIDLPGFGNSGNLGYVHSMVEMAQAVKAVCDHLKLRRYILVGHSMGGYVAAAFAKLYPEPVKGLVFFHSSPSADSLQKKADRTRAMEAIRQNRKAFVVALIDKLFAEANRIRLKKKIAWVKKISAGASLHGILAATEGMRDRDELTPFMRNSGIPQLYVIGKQDIVFSWEQLRDLAGEISTASMILIENCGHMGFIEAPETCMAALKKFWAKAFSEK
jgi:pimeloyl-ACP methyl ester carboxylesterase